MPKHEDTLRRQEALPLTAKGKVRARHAMSSHILGKKNSKRRRRLDAPLMLKKQDEKRAKELLGK